MPLPRHTTDVGPTPAVFFESHQPKAILGQPPRSSRPIPLPSPPELDGQATAVPPIPHLTAVTDGRPVTIHAPAERSAGALLHHIWHQPSKEHPDNEYHGSRSSRRRRTRRRAGLPSGGVRGRGRTRG